MANIYGTKEYEKYWEKAHKLIDDYEFVKVEKEEEECYQTDGIKFHIICYTYNLYHTPDDSFPCRSVDFNEITITRKDGQSKKYNTMDYLTKPQVFHWRDTDYIFMRKALYGYCIINSKNFDEYNYFPSTVLQENREAFISCEVHCLKDLLLIDGCYWGAPYELYILDIQSKKALRLMSYLEIKESADFCLDDDSITLYENGFRITNASDKKEYLIDYSKIKKRIETDGAFDF